MLGPPVKSRSPSTGSTSMLGDLRGARERDPTTAGLAVDADAHLHLVLGQVERRLARGRHGAAGQRHAHRPALAR